MSTGELPGMPTVYDIVLTPISNNRTIDHLKPAPALRVLENDLLSVSSQSSQAAERLTNAKLKQRLRILRQKSKLAE